LLSFIIAAATEIAREFPHMDLPPLVSVVIVNHNYGRYLANCINSVFAQTYPNIEIIVVDDGSTDHSLKVLTAYSDRIRIIQQDNRGPSAARNAGILKSKGEWIALLDSDDYWQPEKLHEQSKYFTEPAVAMVFCGAEYIDDSGSLLGDTHPVVASDLLPKLATFTSPPICGGSTAVLRSVCLQELGGFDETLSRGEDLDLWIRIAAQYEIRAIPTPLARYRIHPGSISADLDLFQKSNHRVLTKVFSNSTCARVHHLRRRAFGRFYMVLAASHFNKGNCMRATRFASKALLYRPAEVSRLLSLPFRRVLRHDPLQKGHLQGQAAPPICVLQVTSLEKANYFLNNLVDHCDRRQVQYVVATLTGEGPFATELRKRGVTVYCLGCVERSRYPRAFRLLLRIIGKHNVDVVHTHLVEPTWLGLSAAKFMARAAVVTRHYSDAIYRVRDPFKRRVYLKLEQYCRSIADHIIAPSQEVRRILVNCEGTPAWKVSVIPYGQEVSRFEAVTKTNVARVKRELGMGPGPALVCLSRLHHDKGHLYLFQALSRLKEEFPALSLYLVGEGPERDALAHSARQAGIDGMVKFLGWRDDALEILAAADVIVHPSLSEALCSALIEARALGKPVVASDVSGTRDILAEYGKIVPPADSDALADAVRSTLTGLDAANRLASLGRPHILESMAASKVAQAHMEVYWSVLARLHFRFTRPFSSIQPDSSPVQAPGEQNV
jgi:glycosyltransferase involved in cell wall biosynthesis